MKHSSVVRRMLWSFSSNRTEEAEKAFREAINIQEKLVAKEPRVNQYCLVRTITNLIIMLTHTAKTTDIEALTKRLNENGCCRNCPRS